MATKDLSIIIQKVSFLGDIMLHWKEDNDFSAFLDSNLGALGYFLWDLRDELQAIQDQVEKEAHEKSTEIENTKT